MSIRHRARLDRATWEAARTAPPLPPAGAKSHVSAGVRVRVRAGSGGAGSDARPTLGERRRLAADNGLGCTRGWRCAHRACLRAGPARAHAPSSCPLLPPAGRSGQTSPVKSTVNIHFAHPSAADHADSRQEGALPGLLPARRSRRAVRVGGNFWIEHQHLRRLGSASAPPGVSSMLPALLGSNIMSPWNHDLQMGVAPEGSWEGAGMMSPGDVSPVRKNAGAHRRGPKPLTAPGGAQEGERDRFAAGTKAERSLPKNGGGAGAVPGEASAGVVPFMTGATVLQGERRAIRRSLFSRATISLMMLPLRRTRP